MTIDTRARAEAHRAHEEVAAVGVPDFEAVIGRRRARRNTRLAVATSAVVVAVAVMAGVAAVATRDEVPTVAVSPSAPPAAPVRAGLSFQSFHPEACNFAGIDGCTLVPDSGSSSDIASAVVRNQGRAGSVVDLTFTLAAAQRFERDTIYTASLDGVPVNAVRGANGTLVLSRAGARQWSEQAANAVAARIDATR